MQEIHSAGRVFAIALLGSSALAQTTSWTGNVSSDWFNGLNWSAGVPTSATTAVIGTGRGFQPVVAAAGAACLDLQVLAGLTVHASRAIEVHGSADLQVSVAGDGAIAFVNNRAAGVLTMAPAASAGIVRITAARDVSMSDVTIRLDLDYAAGAAGKLLWGGTIAVGRDVILRGQEVVKLPGGVDVTAGDDAVLECVATMAAPFDTLAVQDDAITGTSYRPTSGEIVFTGNTNHTVTAANGSLYSIRVLAGTFAPGYVLRGSLIAEAGATLQLHSLTMDPVDRSTLRSATRIQAASLDIPFASNHRRVTIDGVDFGRLWTEYCDIEIVGELTIGHLWTQNSSSIIGDPTDTLTVSLWDLRMTGAFSGVPGTIRLGGMNVHETSSFGTQVGTVVFLGGAVRNQGPSFSVQNCIIEAGAVLLCEPREGGGWFTMELHHVEVRGGTLRVPELYGTSGPYPPGGVSIQSLQVDPGASFVDEVGSRLGTVVVNGTATLAMSDRTRWSTVIDRLVVPAPGSVALITSAQSPGAPLPVTNDLLVDGAMTWPAGAKVLHTGNGNVRGNNLPSFETTGTGCTMQNASVQGDFKQGAGDLVVDRLTVHGNALLAGTSFTRAGATSNLAVTGSIALQPTTPSIAPPGRIECGGSWTSNANFAPTSGTVAFTGSGTQSVTLGGPPLHDVEIGQGASVTLGSLNIRGGLSVAGTLTLTGNGTHALGSLDAAGTVTFPPTSTLDLSGGGMLRAPATSPLPHVRFLSGSYEARAATITGSLLQEAACTSIALGAVTVQGDATFRGGTVTGSGTGSNLTVAGDVRMETSANVVAPPADLTCLGNWTSNARFVPASGRVTFAGPTTAVDQLDAGGTCRFFDLAIAAGIVTALDRIESAGPACTVAAGATLDLLSRRLTVAPSSVLTIDGILRLEQGGSLQLQQNAEVRFSPSSTLRARGRPTNTARFLGVFAGIELAGHIDAQNMLFSGLDARGVRITETATFATAPFDLRGVRVDTGSTQPGSRLLDVRRSSGQPLELWDWELADNAPTTYGVTSTGLGRVDLINFSGGRGGAAFELDPNGVLFWSDRRTELAAHSATGGFLQNRVRFTTAREIAMNQLRVSRAPAASGPWAVLTTLAPQGSSTTGATYEHSDNPVLAGEEWFYRVEERLLHDAWRPLFDDRARAFASQVGDAAFVGAGGFASIDAALAAVPPGGNVVVGAGTHAPFTITRPVHVFAAGDGVARIVGASAVMITGLSPTDPEVSIQGLTIGDGTTIGAAELLRIDNARNVILLDDIVLVAAPGQGALRLVNAPQVKLQKVAADAQVTADAAVAYVDHSAFAALDLRNAARVTHAATTPGTVSSDAGSTVIARPGGSPRLDAPNVWQGDETIGIGLAATPGHLFGVLLDAGLTFVDLSLFVPLDMVLLLPAPTPLFAGVVPPSGQGSLPIAVPENPALHGYQLALQVYALDPMTITGRFGTARHAVFVP